MSSLQLAPVLANPVVSAAAAIFGLAAVVYVVVRLIFRWRAARDLEPNEPPPLLIPVQRRGSEAPRTPLRSVLEGPTAPLAAGLTSAPNGASMSLDYAAGGRQRYGTPPGGNGSAAALANSAPPFASAPSTGQWCRIGE